MSSLPDDNYGGTMQPRMLVLCFDGTANQYSSNSTNVVKLYSLLAKERPYEQITYYQPGVGTYFDKGIVSPVFEWFAKALDDAIAWYLGAHVRDGYRFLMQNYRTGDKICLFGFSRGAYTARALAGFLYKVGLLPKDNDEQIPFAFKLYTRTDKQGIELSSGFKQTFCRSVTIDFIGVWDTVSSVGLLVSRTLPFSSSNAAVKVFRHAVALDEHRARFQPNMYHRQAPGQPNSVTTNATPESSSKYFTKATRYVQSLLKSKQNQTDSQASPSPPDPNVLDDNQPDVLEVWFAGCHSDIGGGSVTNDVTHSLADITLRWMLAHVMRSKCGIIFDDEALHRMGLDDISVQAPIKGSSGSEPNTESNDCQPPLNAKDKANGDGKTQIEVDALQPIYDQLVLNKAWWLLEILPTSYSWQDTNGEWHRRVWINLGKGRIIRVERPLFHYSVKERIEDVALKYSPKAQWTNGQQIYVD